MTILVLSDTSGMDDVTPALRKEYARLVDVCRQVAGGIITGPECPGMGEEVKRTILSSVDWKTPTATVTVACVPIE